MIEPAAYLGKWPAHAIEGEPVTRDQASEIIMRTLGWYMGCNDREWKAIVFGLFGVKLDGHGLENYQAWDEFRQSLQSIETEYFGLGGRVMSSYIGGPTGWLDWDGRIGTYGHNIGKWPKYEEIRDEWVRLAEAFPYLDLRLQMMPDEDIDGPVLAELRVVEGTAEWIEPGPKIERGENSRRSVEEEVGDVLYAVQNPYSGREQGVSFLRLAEALRVTQQRLGGTKWEEQK
jgi:hypothetical protein